METNHTHDPAARSWLESANAPDGDFPIQNLPFAIFRRGDSDETFRGGVAIGDQIIDLAAVYRAGCLEGQAADAVAACSRPALNDFFALGTSAWRALRHGLFSLLEASAHGARVEALRGCLIPQSIGEFDLPARIGDFTDFYTSFHHADNCGRLFRSPEDAVFPNFFWMPVAYHGRTSSIGVSGQRFHRPIGQVIPPGSKTPVTSPCSRLDYEMELGVFIGRGNRQGTPIALDDADDHVFGLCLLNDWSARDVQAWESAPLGPFQAKNFATTISPWIVTMEALAPYRGEWRRSADAPQPLAYLESTRNRRHGALDVQVQVSLETPRRRDAGVGAALLSRTSFTHQYWTIAQMIAHHTLGGCNLRPGDLLGTGTISGPTAAEAGALLELTFAGRRSVPVGDGQDAPVEERTFLQDGDAVVMRGWCEQPGRARIGFGEVRGQVLPARMS